LTPDDALLFVLLTSEDTVVDIETSDDILVKLFNVVKLLDIGTVVFPKIMPVVEAFACAGILAN
jgi:hypothetical protein